MAVKVEVRYLRDGDIEALAANMRQPDIDEVTAASGNEIADILIDSVKHSEIVLAADFDGELACIFGVVPLGGFLGTMAAPWMLGTQMIDKYPSALIRHCGQYLAGMRSRYPHLVNYVDARNTRSIRWLKRMGFTFHPAEPYGVAGLPFHRFEMRT